MEPVAARRIRVICLSGLISRLRNFSRPDVTVPIQVAATADSLNTMIAAVSARRTVADARNIAKADAESRRNFSGFFAGIR